MSIDHNIFEGGSMVLVWIEMLGTLEKSWGRRKEKLVLCGEADVDRILQKLIDEYGEELERSLLDPMLRSPLPNTLILLNGIEINNLKGLKTIVKNEDSITLLSVTHGG